ncbi:type II toxin-antitoxin system HicB family antitoxin [Indiicoccus explosivorum]|uniref:type II toxin-antitoxin system HicB family antitoxin n=1 Tax=Indiicoccus explosivorum TaxID=1917864 RepID=UPI000B43C608|nr:type II toxin-antitoxin system HicB family antitoxin [Indiicoccus explosivorum]
MTLLRYKGYTGKVEIDLEANTLYGEVIDIRDVVTFQGENISQLTEAFHDSVDDYLEFCEGEGVNKLCLRYHN